ncbi:MAG: lipopolysaccharide export system permease protein [Candidatus Azotimanducaceae bacterium]
MILFRYFARETFATMFVVAAVVLVISIGWRFGGYLDRAAAGMMTSEILFALMVFRLPGFLELIVPVSFFLAIMLTYGRLYVDNEMIVLQACGMSTRRLMLLTLGMAAIVMFFTAVISLWLKPLGERQVERLLGSQENLTEFDTLAPGRFQTLSSGQRVTYTEDISREGELSRIFINEYQDDHIRNEPRETATLIAKTGVTQVNANGERFLVLRDGTRYQGKPGIDNYRVIEYEEYGQLIPNQSDREIDRRRTAIPTLALIGNDDLEALSEWHWRISIVLMVPLIALLAIPLSRVNPRQGRFNRLVPAMVLCFVYIVMLSAARSALEKGDIPAGFGLWGVHGVFVVITVLAYQFDRMMSGISRLVPRLLSR